MRTKLLTAILSIALLMSVFGTSMASASLTPSTAIVINGNSELSSYPGTGSASDPKVIANLSIDGNGGVGISIGNVSLHVTIYNCTIFNSTYGIKIFGSSNILVDKNIITGKAGSHGIYLDSSTAYLDRNKLNNCSIELSHNDSSVGVQAYIDAMTIT
jgi:parallel beta-helix repeat protein